MEEWVSIKESEWSLSVRGYRALALCFCGTRRCLLLAIEWSRMLVMRVSGCNELFCL